MGFITSLLLIAFFGFWSYYLYRKYGLPKGHKAFISWYAFIVVGGLMILDALIYLGLLDFIFPILNQLTWVSIDNGPDFMWNSFQLIGIDWGIDYSSPGLLFPGIFIWISYPMWFKWHSNGSRMLFGGNKLHQQGLMFLLERTHKPKGDEKVSKTPEKT